MNTKNMGDKLSIRTHVIACSVDDCTSKIHARGLCEKHYRQFRKSPEWTEIQPKHRNEKFYNLTESEFQDLVEKQNGLCRCCNAPYKCVDHDHVTGAVRGLLCAKCNTALGMVNDSIMTLTNMISYLRNFE